MKVGCIITNRRVKIIVWLGNVRHHPWLRNSKVNHQPLKLCSQFFGMWKVWFWFISLHRVKPLTVRTTVICYERNWNPGSKNWHGAKLVKDATKKLFFLAELKKMWNAGTGALKSRGITLKSNISFVSVHFSKSPCTFWLTFVIVWSHARSNDT
jgi:hypothetical protein